MPQLDFETFPAQLFWLFVTFSVLYIAMQYWIIPRITNVMEERKLRIDNDLSRAESLQNEAQELLVSYERTIANGHANAQAILANASRQISEERSAKDAELTEKLTKLTSEAEDRIARERATALADVKIIAVDVAQKAASKLCGDSISLEEARDAVESVLKEKT